MNNTGGNRDYFVEFTQVNESSLNSSTRKCWYDLWDFTVYDGSTEVLGRLYSKHWSFTAGGGSNRLSTEFTMYPLITSQDDTTEFYVKAVELAGMRPYGFIFMCNAEGTTAGSTVESKRRSQTSNQAYPEYKIFVNDPDSLVWPSADGPAFFVEARSYCSSLDGGAMTITFYAEEPGVGQLILDLDTVPGYQEGGKDRLIEGSFPTTGYHTIFWNGLDGDSVYVESGTDVNFYFQNLGGAVHFPLWDVERNADGFKVQNIRPGTVDYSLLYWDDTNLPSAQFTPQEELSGQNSTTGVHTWGASADDGNNRLVNTWSYGFLNVDTVTVDHTFRCDVDNDTISNFNDIDDDNDGIPDVQEGFGSDPDGDADNNYVPNFLDASFVHPVFGGYRDENRDGINDIFDIDLDGVPNHWDVDADGDGMYDAVEANAGIPPGYFNTATGQLYGSINPTNGMPDTVQTSSGSGVSVYP